MRKKRNRISISVNIFPTTWFSGRGANPPLPPQINKQKNKQTGGRK